MLNVYFWNKNEKMFQTDLEKDFKKTWQQVLVYTSWTGNARILNMPESAEICPNVGKYSSIKVITNVTSWICMNTREILRA